MLLTKIKNDPVLSQFIRDKCEDEGICVNIDNRVSIDNYLVIKVDDFYNELPYPRPKSPDCLIIQRCNSGGYAITIVELKSYNETSRFEISDTQKFGTCLYDFIDRRFRSIFDYNYDFKRVQLIFVSRVYLFGSDNVDKSLMMRIFRQKRFEFRGKLCSIIPQMPATIIKPCY
jgi:hypothetical protein